MDLRPYIAAIHQQLEAAAEAGGDDARALAERLAAPLDAALRLAMQDVLAAAAEEITTELAPGSVELRLRGRNPEFVVTPPPAEAADDDPHESTDDTAAVSGPPATTTAPRDTDDGAMSRINLRIPDQLKARIDQAAAAEGVSANSWLARAATAALERGGPQERPRRRAPQSSQRYTGWAR